MLHSICRNLIRSKAYSQGTPELLWNNSLQSLCKFKCVSLSCSSSVWCSMKNCRHRLFWREMTDAILIKVTNSLLWIKFCEIVRARWQTILPCNTTNFPSRGKPACGYDLFPIVVQKALKCFWLKMWRLVYSNWFQVPSEINYFKIFLPHYQGNPWNLYLPFGFVPLVWRSDRACEVSGKNVLVWIEALRWIWVGVSELRKVCYEITQGYVPVPQSDEIS